MKGQTAKNPLASMALKDIAKSKNAVHKYMIAVERRQIPVCREHHLELHGGNWSNRPSKIPDETK